MFLEKLGNFENFENFDVTAELFPLAELWNFKIKSVILELEILDFHEYLRISKMPDEMPEAFCDNFESFHDFEAIQNREKIQNVQNFIGIGGNKNCSGEVGNRRKTSFLNTRKTFS